MYANAENPQQGSENRSPLPNPWGGNQSDNNRSSTDNPPQNVLNTPSMQSLLQQIGDNPSLMSNMMSAPYTRNMLEALSADPNMAANVLVTNNIIFYPNIQRISSALSVDESKPTLG